MQNITIIISILVIMIKYSLEGIVKKRDTRSADELKMELAKEVVRRRIERQQTQKEFSADLGIPLTTYCIFEQSGDIPFKYFLKIVCELKGDADLLRAVQHPAFVDIRDITPRNSERMRVRK